MDATMLSALRPKKAVKTVEGLSSILYGDPKTGKTTTLDDPNMKILILDIEGGTSVLRGAPHVDIVPIQTLEQLNAAADLLDKNQWVDDNGKLVPLDYSLVAIDSITRLQDLVKDYVVREVAPNRQREKTDKKLAPIQRFGARSDWGDFGQIIKDLVKEFHSFTKRGEKSINVMWLAHRENKHENPNVETMVTGTQIMMQGGAVAEVMSVVDSIFYMNKVTKPDKETKKENTHYFIQTDKIGIVDAGVRQSKRDERLAKVIENPVWSDIFEQLGYKVDRIENK